MVNIFCFPNIKYNKAVAQFWGELARRLADEHLLPFDVEEYGTALEGYEASILEGYGDLMKENGLEDGLSKQFVQNYAHAYDTSMLKYLWLNNYIFFMFRLPWKRNQHVQVSN